MARLPKVGDDKGTWGEILNDYLAQSHDEDGSLRTNTVGAPQLRPNAVMTPTIGDGQVTTSKLADAAAGTAQIADHAITEEKLANAVCDKLNASPPALGDGSVTTEMLADQSVTLAKIKDLGALAAEATSELVLRPSGGNDSPIIEAAYALAASTGRRLRLAEGIFRWDSNGAGFKTALDFSGAGVDRTIIQLGAGVSNGPRWAGGKAQVGGANSVSSATAGARTLSTTANLTAGLSAGDTITLTSGKSFSTRNYYNEGEFNVVKAIDSTTITLLWPLRFDYDTADNVKLYRYRLLRGVRASGFTVKAHENNVRQNLIRVAMCERPILRDVRVWGPNAFCGIQIAECVDAQVDQPTADDIKDLANPGINTWAGYGVLVTGALNTRIRGLVAHRCRHAFDDGSGTGLPPAFGTTVNGIAYDCPSAGFSTHGGSDECFFDDCETVNCGGGFIVRGRAARARGARVRGCIRNASPNEYTALGGDNQNYTNALTIGEPPADETISYAGTRIDWEFASVDMRQAGSTANVIRARYGWLVDSTFTFGDVWHDQDSHLIHVRSDRQSNVRWRGGTFRNTGAGIALAFEPDDRSVGLCQADVAIEDMTFDGYANKILSVSADTTPAGPSRGIAFRRNRIKNPRASYADSAPVVAIEAGYFSSTAGSVRIEDNDLSDALPTAIVTSNANAGVGLGDGLTQRGNSFSNGYDGAP